MTELIDVEGASVKSLFLRGKAYLQKEQQLQAYSDFSEALNLESGNSLLQTQVQDMKSRYPDIDDRL